MELDQSLTVSVLGTPISRLSLDQALKACLEDAKQGRGGYACFANVHTVTESTSHPALARALAGARYAFADGMPLVWTSRIKQIPIGSRVCGPDFMKELITQTRDEPHGFIGGAPSRAQELVKHFGLTQSVCLSPPMRAYSIQNAEDDWNTFLTLCPGGVAPRHVWVGLGAPKQELWVAHVSKLAPQTLFYAVGAAFDFLSGSKPRAPRWMQDSGLEWAYRLATEPKRLWKRYLITNTKFLALSAKELVSPKSGSRR